MRLRLFVPILAAGLALGHPAPADPLRGQDKAAACVACHGEGGNSTTSEIPSLAGHPSPYLTVQLILFREEQRKNPVMTPIAKGLSDADIEDLAAYFSSQVRTPPEASSGDPGGQGKRLADANHCGSCHRPGYSGHEQIPRLAAQREDYLLKTMRDYKAGERSGLDGLMTSVLYNLSDADLGALAAYLARLP